MVLTLEQTQQGVSYEVLFDESNTNMLERFYTSAGNPVKEILLKLNLPDHSSILTDSKILKDGGQVKEFQRSFSHSDTERLSRSDEVLKLKNFKKDATLKLFKSTNHKRVRGEIQEKCMSLTDVMAPLVEPLSSKSLTGKASTSVAPATADPISTLSMTFAPSDVVPPLSVPDYQVLDTEPHDGDPSSTA
ncbi:hypothetical protein Tco_0825051 [Tanacetum coccineum]